MTKSTKKTKAPPGARKAAKSAARSKPRGRPRGSGASRQKILTVATKLFADRGFAALSIRDIAAATQLNIPSIYHFFGGKENLYYSCCADAFSAIAAKLNAGLRSVPGPKSRIKKFTVDLCEVLLENRDFRRLLMQEIIMRDETHLFDEISRRYFLPEFRLLVEEVAALEGRKGAEQQALSVYALTFGLILLRQTFEAAGVALAAAASPARLAERVLGSVFPHQTWDG